MAFEKNININVDRNKQTEIYYSYFKTSQYCINFEANNTP